MNGVSEEKKTISSFLRVRRRYVRSVNIERDIADPQALEGYIITPAVSYAVERLLPALRTESTQRAWRLTGPYGSGKSAFGLFLAKLLNRSDSVNKIAEAKLAENLPNAGSYLREIPSYLPVPITGRRVSFTDALSESLFRILQASSRSGRHPRVFGELLQYRERRQKGLADDIYVLHLLEDFAKYVHRSTLPYDGVLLLIDELGKFLEYVALHPEQADAFVFQQLGEKASGANGIPLAVIGFLHHRFADYALEYGQRIQEEWAKVAERFEDIPFQESLQQYAFLLGDAIHYEEEALRSSGVLDHARTIYRKAVSGQWIITGQKTPELVEIAANLFPIHPTVLTALSFAMIRFGQNERSLFAFLLSHEPYGFQQFIDTQPLRAGCWYRLPNLYDYLAAQGDMLIADGDRRRRWDLLKDLLNIGQPLSDTEEAVLKSIGLINLLEPLPGLSASKETVTFALCDRIKDRAVERGFGNLLTKGLLFRRGSKNDYCLWPHSSVDLNSVYEQAKRSIPPSNRIDYVLQTLPATRPLIAHRHYHRTGTLRTFRVRTIQDISVATSKSSLVPGSHDGEIVIIPIYPDQNFAAVQKSIMNSEIAKNINRLCYLRKVKAGDLALARELKLWQWIDANCQELRADDFARNEVKRRLTELAQDLVTRIEDLRRLDHLSQAFEGKWIHQSRIVGIFNRTDLNQKLSEICDKLYSDSPVMKNELINRSKISPAVASARNKLIAQMYDNEDKEYFGLTGMPPEKAIYLSVFKASELHRKEREKWGLHPPSKDDPCHWQPAWNALRSFLQESGRISVVEILGFLAGPPFGIREAVATLFLATLLRYYSHDLLLFEKGSYVVNVTPEHFMRLLKNPGNFSIHYVRTDESLANILDSFYNEIDILKAIPVSTISVVYTVEQIYKWFLKLPSYTMHTNRVSKTAQRVRTVLKKAIDPAYLLYNAFPKACGWEEGFYSGTTNRKEIRTFLKRLNSALNELDAAEQDLCSELEDILLHAFQLGGSLAELRSSVRNNYLPFAEELVDYKLKSFLNRAADSDLSDGKWLESIGNLFTGRSVVNWQDKTVVNFEAEAKAIAGKLKRWAALLMDHNRNSTEYSDLVGVYITNVTGVEHSISLQKDAKLPAKLESLKKKVRALIGDDPAAHSVLIQLLAEILSSDKQAQEGRDEAK